MPRFLYYFLIIAIALLAVNFVRSVWDRYFQRKGDRSANDLEEFPERNPWEFPEKED
jgi:TRAP-type C4-dicarboxylate transport system permease small subunit